MSVHLLIPPRVMQLHNEYTSIQKQIKNCDQIIACRTYWAEMEKESSLETPLFDLILKAEAQRFSLRLRENELLREIKSFL